MPDVLKPNTLISDAPIYLFDGECVLCSKGVHYVLKYEDSPDMRFIAIQSGEGRKLAKTHGIDPDDPQSFLFIEDGTVYQKSDAALNLAKRVGGWGQWLLWTRFIPRPLRDVVYSLIAKNRYRLFGKLESCYVPAPDQKHRFVMK